MMYLLHSETCSNGMLRQMCLVQWMGTNLANLTRVHLNVSTETVTFVMSYRIDKSMHVALIIPTPQPVDRQH
jgi:hypothetical protein